MATPDTTVTPANTVDHTAPAGGLPIHFDPNVPALETDVPALVTETRRGWKTSEFWAALSAVVLDLGLSVDSKDKIAVTALAAFYAIARGIAKSGVPNREPV